MDRPMLYRQIERIRRSNYAGRLIIATSREASDDAVEDFCRVNSIDFYRGDLDDVLDRFYQAYKTFTADHVVRMTGDCPLIDPAVIDEVISFHLNGGYDYTSNTSNPTYPDGLDVEIVKGNALETAWKDAKLLSEREHVTPYIKNHPEIFKCASYEAETDLSHLRWTVDEPEDMEFVRRVYGLLYEKNPAFAMRDILELLEERPELSEINGNFIRNEGYEKSLLKDRELGKGNQSDE